MNREFKNLIFAILSALPKFSYRNVKLVTVEIFTVINLLLGSLAIDFFQFLVLVQFVGHQGLACHFHSVVLFLQEKQPGYLRKEQVLGGLGVYKSLSDFVTLGYTALLCQHEGHTFIFWAICTRFTRFSPGFPSLDGEFHPSSV